MHGYLFIPVIFHMMGALRTYGYWRRCFIYGVVWFALSAASVAVGACVCLWSVSFLLFVFCCVVELFLVIFAVYTLRGRRKGLCCFPLLLSLVFLSFFMHLCVVHFIFFSGETFL